MPFAAALSTAGQIGRAAEEVAAAADFGAQPDLAIAFVSPHHADDLADLAADLRRRLSPQCLIGCVGEAICGTGREIEGQPAVSLWLANWQARVQVEPFHLTLEQTPDGPTLLGWPDVLLEADPAQEVMLALGDPFTFPALELFLPRVNEDTPGLRVHGGLVSGLPGPGSPRLILNDTAIDSGAVGVVLHGHVRSRSIVSQGCKPIGTPLEVTRASGNVIAELAGQPPVMVLRDLYHSLSERDQGLFQGGLHVGLAMNEFKTRYGRGDFLIRNLYGIDPKTGAVAITDRVGVGQTVQFHLRDAAAADEDLRHLLREDKAANAGRPGGALLFTCNGRGRRLFGTPDHDAAAIRDEIGAVPLAGFFAAGEIGPVGGENFLHGFTASAVVFEE